MSNNGPLGNCCKVLKEHLIRHVLKGRNEGFYRPAFFTCVLTRSARLAFIGENFVLEKLESPLI